MRFHSLSRPSRWDDALTGPASDMLIGRFRFMLFTCDRGVIVLDISAISRKFTSNLLMLSHVDKTMCILGWKRIRKEKLSRQGQAREIEKICVNFHAHVSPLLSILSWKLIFNEHRRLITFHVTWDLCEEIHTQASKTKEREEKKSHEFALSYFNNSFPHFSFFSDLLWSSQQYARSERRKLKSTRRASCWLSQQREKTKKIIYVKANGRENTK